MGKEAEKKKKDSKDNKTETKKIEKSTKNEKKIRQKDKKSKTKKILIITIPIIIIICIIGFLWFTNLNVSNNVTVQLVIDSGLVEVKHVGSSWTSASNGMLLEQSDTIKTGKDTSASVILFKGSIIRLDSNTKIKIKEIINDADKTYVKIEQDSGRTWNTISKISGIDDYEVQTPTTVASVRGTAFVVIVEPNGTTYYGVSHGIVNVSSISDGVIQGSINVSGNESVIVYVDKVGGSLEIKPFEMDDWVLENLLKDDQFVTDVKAELYSRIEPYIPQLKQLYGVTDEELDVLLDGYIRGDFTLPANTPDWIRDIIELS